MLIFSPEAIAGDSPIKSPKASLVIRCAENAFLSLYNRHHPERGAVGIGDSAILFPTNESKLDHSPKTVFVIEVREGKLTKPDSPEENSKLHDGPLLFRAWLRWDAPHPVFGRKEGEDIHAYWVVEKLVEGEWVDELALLADKLLSAKEKGK